MIIIINVIERYTIHIKNVTNILGRNVFHLTKLMFMLQEYLEGVLELQPLQEFPE